MDYDITNFQKEVLEKSYKIPVLVDFWAEWCQPCKMLSPILERLAIKHQGKWMLAKVNTEAHQEVALQYGISGIPNVKIFIEGSVTAEFTGALPEYAIEQWLKKVIPGKYDKKLTEARSLIDQSQPEIAETILNEVLKKDPDNIRAKVMLAQIVIFSDAAEAIELVKNVPQEAKEYELAEALQAFADLFIKAETPEKLPESEAKQHCINAVNALHSRDFDTALSEFIESMKKDRTFNDECSRKACLAIFKYLGEENEITKKHRRAFGAALYV